MVVFALTVAAAETAGAQTFAGTVTIAGQPAAPGTLVQVVVFNSTRQFTICGSDSARNRTTGTRGAGGAPLFVAGYQARLLQTAECLASNNTYEFYVNGVWAGHKRGGLSSRAPISYYDLTVDEVALLTGSLRQATMYTGMRLLWFYGTVTDDFNRPVPAGTKVTAEEARAACSGSTVTEDLTRPPSGLRSERIGDRGFFRIGIPLNICADFQLTYELYAGSEKVHVSHKSLRATPPYGRAYHVDLRVPVARGAGDGRP